MKIEEFLANHVLLFADFSAQELGELVNNSEVITFEPNEAVLEFGEKGHFLGVLLDGEAEAAITDDSGEKHKIDTLKTGDLFGEMELMTGDKNIADVIGVTRCQALLIPQALFSTKLITHPQAIQHLSRIISQRMKNHAFDITGKNGLPLKQQKDPYGFTLQSSKSMKIFVFNSSSTWIRYQLFSTSETITAQTQEIQGSIEGIGNDKLAHHIAVRGEHFTRELPAISHSEAVTVILKTLTNPEYGIIRQLSEITAVSHRVVHGGAKFNSAVVITEQVLTEIEKLSVLAPLHNPINLAVIREAQKHLPVTHIAVFDTAFHQTLPAYAYLYGLPLEYYEKYQIRRYGFHGMSHRYAALKAAELLNRPYNALEIVTCHLGSGTSLCAIDHGRSVDTTMGFTPADGLIMSTRSGSLDPGILLYLMREEKMGTEDLDALINKHSGLLGLSGISGDILEIEEKAASDADNRAILAIKTYAYQVRKQIGAYMAAMGGLDVLVFTGGVGVKSALVRSLACHGLDCLGINLDTEKNRTNGAGNITREISAPHSQVKVVVVLNEEERMMARETIKVLEQDYVSRIINSQGERPIPIEVSAHHIHLSREHVEALFGQGYQLTEKAPLSQPGQFACHETVTLSGPKGTIERVRVLGPERKETQVEIAMTEQFKLGIQPPIRESGDLNGTPGITIVSEKGSITIAKGVICAMRHIHMSPEEALQYGLRDKDVVRVRVEGDRELIYGDVLIRVKPDYRLAMHIDTDEANAAHIQTGIQGYVDSIQSRG